MNCLTNSAALLFAVVLLSGAAWADEGTVKLDVKDETVEVTVGGEEFAVYNFGKDLPKPYLAPVRGPGGTVLTEVGSSDHRHHKGVWVSIDEVNGIRFWAERGKIRNVSVKPLAPQGNPARMQVVNHWLDEDDQPVLIETTTITISPSRLLAYDINLEAGDRKVTFEDTKEGLFAIRFAPQMTGRAGATIVNADGAEGEKEAWGRTSDWVDYYNEVEGKTVGVAIFDHPENFRRSRYHVRNYGLFAISPFGESSYTNRQEPAKPLTLEPGQSVRLRYGLYVHAGDTKEGRVAETYRKFVEAAK